jgi:hypothetical protein
VEPGVPVNSLLSGIQDLKIRIPVQVLSKDREQRSGGQIRELQSGVAKLVTECVLCYLESVCNATPPDYLQNADICFWPLQKCSVCGILSIRQWPGHVLPSTQALDSVIA